MTGEYKGLGQSDPQVPLFGADQLGSLSATAHDLKAPLSSVRYLAATLRDPEIALTDAQQNDYLWRIELTAQRGLSLAESLTYAYSTTQTELQLEPVDVSQVCSGVLHDLSPLARRLAQTLELKVPRASKLALAHQQVLRSVVTNLCDNALKHNPPESHVVVNVTHNNNAVQIAVRDNGPKVSARDYKSLKKRLGNEVSPLGNRVGDSGLGLYVASRLAKAMQGDVRLSRHQRGGMTFALWLQPSYQLTLL